MNVYLEELVFILDWPEKSHTLPNWSVIFSSQSTEDTILEMGFGMMQYA